MGAADAGVGSSPRLSVNALRRVNVATWVALALVALDALVATAFGPQPSLAACVLILAPGLALTPFFPTELAKAPAVRIVVVPAVGAAVSSIAIVSASAATIDLTGTSIRLIVLGIVLVSVVASLAFDPVRRAARVDTVAEGPTEGATIAFLGAILALGITLQGLIVGAKPLPGQDWGHYLLYADEIRNKHSLLIDNPYWMLGGLRFPDDPGIASLYGAYAILADQGAARLLQGIWVVAALAIISVFVFVAVLWGRTAGLIAAALYAVIPMNLDMLAWHGLANVWALVLLPIVLLAAGIALRGDGDRRWSFLLAVFLVSLAAAHRLSLLVALLTLLVCLGIGLYARARPTLRFTAWTAAFVFVIGAGVFVDLTRRNLAAHGAQGYRAFLATKVNWDFVARDLTKTLVVISVVALVVLIVARPLRLDPARWVLLALLAAVVALSYAWVVHFPLSYNRAAFYLPLVVAAAIGVAWATVARRLAFAAVLVVLFVGHEARDLAGPLRTFYGYTNAQSLTGLGYIQSLARPGDVVVTDTCWGFLSTWLLRQPLIAAQDPALILPQNEVAPARTARAILYGSHGSTLARRVGARFALVDPQCTHQDGRLVAPPKIGTPIYASTRLVVLDLRKPRIAQTRS